MLRLSMPAGPRWLDLPHGVRVLARPVDTAVSEAAYAEATEAVRSMQEEAEAAEKAGQPLDPNGRTGANAAWVSGVRWQRQVEALLRYTVEEWDGVGDADGAPWPPCDEAFRAFAANRELAGAFFRAAMAPVEALVAEGNGSANPSAGDAAAG